MNRTEALLIRKECALLCDSRAFRSSERMRRLLHHLIERTLLGDKLALSQRRLAIDFFERNQDFDPEQDTIVRVEISKLRRSLREFYLGQVQQRDVVIMIHPNNYSLVFDFPINVRTGQHRAVVEFDGTDHAESLPGGSGDNPRLGWLSDGLRQQLASILQQNSSYYVAPKISDLATYTRLDPLGEDIDVFECALRFDQYLQGLTLDHYRPARESLERVFKQKPENPLVLSMLGDLRRAGSSLGFAPENNALEESIEMHQKAIALQPELHSSRVSFGFSLLMTGDVKAVKNLANTIVGDIEASYTAKADAFLLLALAGDWEVGSRGIRTQVAGVRGYPAHLDYIHCLAAYDAGDYAAAMGETDLLKSTGCFWESMLKAACLGQLRNSAAETELDELCRRRPDFESLGRDYIGAFIPSEKTVDHILAGVRKAGLQVS